jgi:hypothetical protein
MPKPSPPQPPPVFEPGAAVVLQRGELTMRPHRTGSIGTVLGAASCCWLRVNVAGERLKWHRRHMQRHALPEDFSLTDGALGLVLAESFRDSPLTLARAAQVCRAWRDAARDPWLWSVVDFLQFPGWSSGYWQDYGGARAAIHLVAVQAPLRSLRLVYGPVDRGHVHWLLERCDMRSLERATLAERFMQTTLLVPSFNFERTDAVAIARKFVQPRRSSTPTWMR